MRPLETFTAADRRGIVGVLADIDDTLTSHGRLQAAAFAALERLHESGLMVVPVTGRPAGWCDHIARMWPVDGVVGENGAFYFRYRRDDKRMQKCYAADAETRRANRAKLDRLRDRILSEVPGAAVASDQGYRESDLAIDYREDVAPLSAAQVRRVVAIFAESGATAKVSSIHVNGWFGDYDKLGMTLRMMRECFDLDMAAERERFVFVGDSPNDAPMFSYFPNSVGVANVAEFIGQLDSEPTYVTRGRGGAGFAEVAEALLEARIAGSV